MIQTPVTTTRRASTSLVISCAPASRVTLENNAIPILMTARTNLVSTMAHVMTLSTTIPAHVLMVTEDTTARTILTSVFHRRVPTTPHVQTSLEVINASVSQVTREGCVQ